MAENHNDKSTSSGTSSLGRDILFFFLRFLAASIVLYVIFEPLGAGRLYSVLIAYIAKPFLSLMHYRMVLHKALSVTEEISLNPVVFISLVIATVGLTYRERLKAILIGFLILTAANALTIFMIFLSYYKRSETLWAQSEFLNLTINFFVPILLWFALVPSTWQRVFTNKR